jgi:uncharacterized damage-inducible protein DinB
VTLADFRTLFDYSDKCWGRLRNVLEAHPAVFDAPFETTSNWNTVRLLLAHCVAAEERWIFLRLQNIPVPVPYEQRAPATIEGLYADRKASRRAARAYLASLAEADLQEETDIELPQWEFRDKLTRADILFHMVNHDNYHRGQVVTALQRFGLDPPNFDFVLLKYAPVARDDDGSE